jgi:hypothetical protein
MAVVAVRTSGGNRLSWDWQNYNYKLHQNYQAYLPLSAGLFTAVFCQHNAGMEYAIVVELNIIQPWHGERNEYAIRQTSDCLPHTNAV